MTGALGIAPRGPNIIELDRLAQEPDAPYGIITADCTNPCEIDDGIAVELLPSASELYRVRVFAVDTSPLYTDEEIARKVIERTESRYRNPDSDHQSYEPMIEPEIVERIHFRAGHVRKALITSFIVGEDQPPTAETVEFGRVEVRQNINYARFGSKCRYSPNFEAYGRAAALILHHLAPEGVSEEFERIYGGLIHVPSEAAFKRGAGINSAYMVGANYIAGRIARKEAMTAIYRVHDLDDPKYKEIFDPRVAYYSTTPGPHDGLGVDVYSRVTSPLRRSEDFIMHGLLRARFENRALNGRDNKLVKQAVQRLNQRVVKMVYSNTYRQKDQDFWIAGS